MESGRIGHAKDNEDMETKKTTPENSERNRLSTNKGARQLVALNRRQYLKSRLDKRRPTQAMIPNREHRLFFFNYWILMCLHLITQIAAAAVAGVKGNEKGRVRLHGVRGYASEGSFITTFLSFPQS